MPAPAPMPICRPPRHPARREHQPTRVYRTTCWFAPISAAAGQAAGRARRGHVAQRDDGQLRTRPTGIAPRMSGAVRREPAPDQAEAVTWNGAAGGLRAPVPQDFSPRLVQLGDMGTGEPDAERVWLPRVSERGEPDSPTVSNARAQCGPGRRLARSPGDLPGRREVRLVMRMRVTFVHGPRERGERGAASGVIRDAGGDQAAAGDPAISGSETGSVMESRPAGRARCRSCRQERAAARQRQAAHQPGKRARAAATNERTDRPPRRHPHRHFCQLRGQGTGSAATSSTR